MARRSRPPSGRRTEPIQWAQVVPGYASTILKFSLLAMLLAIGYLLYGIFGGYLSQPASERVVANIRLMGQVLIISGSLSALCLIIITFAEIVFAVAAGIVGLAMLWGTPFLIANNLRDPTSEVAGEIHLWATATGKAIIFIVSLRLLYEIYLQLTRGSERRRRIQKEEVETAAPQAKKTETIWPWTPCWQMPFCHTAIRDLCPAYKAHRTCWRYGSGCNCDPNLVEAVVRSGAGAGGARDAGTRRVQEAYIRSDLEADTVRPQQKRTIPCSKCAIYNEHQRAKYRVINPIAIISTIVALIVLYPPLMTLYRGFVAASATLASRLTFSNEIDPRTWFEYLDTPTIRVFFVIILGLLILSYVLRAVEWAILVKKI